MLFISFNFFIGLIGTMGGFPAVPKAPRGLNGLSLNVICRLFIPYDAIGHLVPISS